jgi:outer membrane protein assembly factor BamB
MNRYVLLGLCVSLWSATASGFAADALTQFPSYLDRAQLPTEAQAQGFPQEWRTYSFSNDRNPAFAAPADSPAGQPIAWAFAGAGAAPLDRPVVTIGGSHSEDLPPDSSPLDPRTVAYVAGMPVGVSVVRGIVYVGSDNGYTYALNALTGRVIWAHYGWNMTMSNPLVVEGRVFVTTGNPFFNYEQTMNYVKGKPAIRGPGLNSIFALDALTGEERWRYHTPGEIMPTAAYHDGALFVGTGDGHMYAVEAGTGKLRWKSVLESFVSMSSTLAAEGLLFVGGTRPHFLYALDPATGRIVWKQTIPKVVATGIGDGTPSYAEGLLLQMFTVETGQSDAPLENVLVAIEAKTGAIRWQQRLGPGGSFPGMKVAVATVVEGTVYAASPVSQRYFAFDLQSGQVRWATEIGGRSRSGAAIKDGIAYLPLNKGELLAIRTKDGAILSRYKVGGGFGPATPVLVGQTLYTANMFGWVHAIPIHVFSIAPPAPPG